MVGKHQKFALIQNAWSFKQIVRDDRDTGIRRRKPIEDIRLDLYGMVHLECGIRALRGNEIDRFVLERILIQRFTTPRIISDPGRNGRHDDDRGWLLISDNKINLEILLSLFFCQKSLVVACFILLTDRNSDTRYPGTAGFGRIGWCGLLHPSIQSMIQLFKFERPGHSAERENILFRVRSEEEGNRLTLIIEWLVRVTFRTLRIHIGSMFVPNEGDKAVVIIPVSYTHLRAHETG